HGAGGQTALRLRYERRQMGLAPTPVIPARDLPARAGLTAARARRPEGPNYVAAVLFLLPATVLLAVFLLYPALYTVLLSFNRGRNGVFTEWVGLDNYVRLFSDPDFLNLTFPPSGALKSIPAEIIESARVEGAKERQIFFRIILPMVSLPMSVLAVTLIVNVIKLFDLIYVMTAGGPGKASRVIAFTMYQQAMQAGQFGYGSAVAVVMLVVLIPIMVFNVRRFRTKSVT